ncbi:hypothetical protein CD144_07660 [Staphylococcus equorum subsp. linens]|jgi:hypothetical protein|nr:hypothetical protein CD144_07660 [Staphylococcus equorum subsp. linens]PTE26338.1 hypothetical protein BUY92_01415 [Staphylococcus equorum]RTX79993.1 hypothetical protein CD125_02425 [Staphylococcus equorum subsp. equorum]PTE29199.1 hypothetical protein BUY91_01825 [Staphylococcus equorum]PTE29896.1 hypothetical protein BUY83_08850 [Staphylococcus equorum]
MKKILLSDILNLFVIALIYMVFITLILFSLDLFEIQTTGSIFLEKLSSITIFQIFRNTLFNGLFTLFLFITCSILIFKSIDLYANQK